MRDVTSLHPQNVYFNHWTSLSERIYPAWFISPQSQTPSVAQFINVFEAKRFTCRHSLITYQSEEWFR